MSGSDRVEIVWTTGSIANRWLEVGIKDNAQTGLAASGNNINGTSVGDIFFWGNRVGDVTAILPQPVPTPRRCSTTLAPARSG